MALYHIHRPQHFEAIIGQEHIVRTLANQITTGRVGHAYLFSGPRGVGKTTTARIVAKALNCKERKTKDPNPCDECGSCVEISDGRSIDVIEIDAASHTGVDHVREHIIENSRFKPSKSAYKVFIIDEVHMLSTSAFNALLKTLEEPPAHVVFILATTESQKLPQTIVSRCQHFSFSTVARDILQKYLEKIAKTESTKVDKEVLGYIIQKSGGCVRDAVSLLDQILSSGEKNITPDVAKLFLPISPQEDVHALVRAVVESDVSASLAIIQKLADRGQDMTQFMDAVTGFCRIILLAQMENSLWPELIDSNETKAEVLELKQNITPERLMALIDGLIERRNQIKLSPLPQLPLEMLVISTCGQTAGRGQSPSGDRSKGESEVVKTESAPVVVSAVEPPAPIAAPPAQTAKKSVTARVKELVGKEERLLDENVVRTERKQLVQKLESVSPSLVFILKLSEIVSIEKTTINLSVQYQFHKDKLMDKPTYRKLTEMLAESLGIRVDLVVVVKEGSQGVQTSNTSQNHELQELAAAFGGEVV